MSHHKYLILMRWIMTNIDKYWILTRWAITKYWFWWDEPPKYLDFAYMNHKECGIKQFWYHQEIWSSTWWFVLSIKFRFVLNSGSDITLSLHDAVLETSVGHEQQFPLYYCDCDMSLAEQNWTWLDGVLHGNFLRTPVFPFLVADRWSTGFCCPGDF